jgi:hypothetical protein
MMRTHELRIMALCDLVKIKREYFGDRHGAFSMTRQSRRDKILTVIPSNSESVAKNADPDKHDIKAFSALDNLPDKRGPGGLICLYDKPLPLKGNDMIIPLHYV